MAVRLLIVAVLAVAVAVAVLRWRRVSAHDQQLGGQDANGEVWPTLPDSLRSGNGDRTWVIFTTPLCASCPQVQSDLTASFPSDVVLKIDATEQPELASRYAVRRAPTTLLADASGLVVDRLVGPEAVRSYITAGVD